MIPTLAEVLAAQRFLARRHGFDPTCDSELVARCLGDAAALAGRTEDEPAAVLFALSRHGRALRAGWQHVPLLLLANGARARRLMLDGCDAHDVAFEEVRLRVAFGRATFEEVRAFVAARLRPLE